MLFASSKIFYQQINYVYFFLFEFPLYTTLRTTLDFKKFIIVTFYQSDQSQQPLLGGEELWYPRKKKLLFLSFERVLFCIFVLIHCPFVDRSEQLGYPKIEIACGNHDKYIKCILLFPGYWSLVCSIVHLCAHPTLQQSPC